MNGYSGGINIYYGILLSHTKKNEILPFAMMWMELEYIMLSQVSQSEKDKYHMILFICGIKTDKHMERGKKEKP